MLIGIFVGAVLIGTAIYFLIGPDANSPYEDVHGEDEEDTQEY